MLQFKMPCYVIAGGLFLVAASCAPSSTNRPNVAPSNEAPGPSAGANRAPAEGSSATKESNTPSSSSLDQLREGKSSATPAASPLKEVYFDYDRSDLRSDARTVLRTNADWLKNNPAIRIEIEGHCDDRGTNEYNLALGAKRAQAVKDYLATLGISAERLSTISYGAEIPVCKEQTESCWQQNRRARFVLLANKQAS